MSEKKIYKPKPISGFPEWLPEVRYAEQQWMDIIRATFESYGFCNIETPSVEEVEVISAKGEVDKEIYVLNRLHADEDDDKEARLALHFDQTVPLARYVAMNFNDLTFPFKRYQMQRVWRGERPQEGRFREFYQCDIDVIHVDNLPLYFDAEMPAIIHQIFNKLDIGAFEIVMNNRKILTGYLEGLGIKDIISAIRILDKFDKIGRDGVIKTLIDEMGLSPTTANRAVALASIRTKDSSFATQVRELGVTNETLETGLDELSFVIDQLPQDNIVVDLSIARGLDYYTGTVYETRLLDALSFGSVCSGGRYEDLAGTYINKHLPGVGISIGFSRLFSKFAKEGRFDNHPKSPADILVTLPSEEDRAHVHGVCQALRARGIKVDMFHSATKQKKQIAYAEKKGIPYVWFFDFDDINKSQVKDLSNGEQVDATPETWLPERLK